MQSIFLSKPFHLKPYIVTGLENTVIIILYTWKIEVIECGLVLYVQLNCWIPCHWFARHWIRIVSIVFWFVLTRTPLNSNNSGRVFSSYSICTLIYNDMQHHNSQNVADSRYAAEWVHNINFVFTTISMSKKRIFSKGDQDHDTKKALYITLLQADWFIAQNEHLRLAITTGNSYHKNSESSELTLMLSIKFFSQKYNSNCSVIANIRSEL